MPTMWRSRSSQGAKKRVDGGIEQVREKTASLLGNYGFKVTQEDLYRLSYPAWALGIDELKRAIEIVKEEHPDADLHDSLLVLHDFGEDHLRRTLRIVKEKWPKADIYWSAYALHDFGENALRSALDVAKKRKHLHPKDIYSISQKIERALRRLYDKI